MHFCSVVERGERLTQQDLLGQRQVVLEWRWLQDGQCSGLCNLVRVRLQLDAKALLQAVSRDWRKADLVLQAVTDVLHDIDCLEIICHRNIYYPLVAGAQAIATCTDVNNKVPLAVPLRAHRVATCDVYMHPMRSLLLGSHCHRAMQHARAKHGALGLCGRVSGSATLAALYDADPLTRPSSSSCVGRSGRTFLWPRTCCVLGAFLGAAGSDDMAISSSCCCDNILIPSNLLSYASMSFVSRCCFGQGEAFIGRVVTAEKAKW